MLGVRSLAGFAPDYGLNLQSFVLQIAIRSTRRVLKSAFPAVCVCEAYAVPGASVKIDFSTKSFMQRAVRDRC